MANSKPKYLVKVRYIGFIDNEFDYDNKLEESINRTLNLYNDEIFVNIIQCQRGSYTEYYMITKYKNKKHET